MANDKTFDFDRSYIDAVTYRNGTWYSFEVVSYSCLQIYFTRK